LVSWKVNKRFKAMGDFFSMEQDVVIINEMQDIFENEFKEQECYDSDCDRVD
jgi:hypothetical protein